jgi:hypothetical protein
VGKSSRIQAHTCRFLTDLPLKQLQIAPHNKHRLQAGECCSARGQRAASFSAVTLWPTCSNLQCGAHLLLRNCTRARPSRMIDTRMGKALPTIRAMAAWDAAVLSAVAASHLASRHRSTSWNTKHTCTCTAHAKARQGLSDMWSWIKCFSPKQDRPTGVRQQHCPLQSAHIGAAMPTVVVMWRM